MCSSCTRVIGIFVFVTALLLSSATAADLAKFGKITDEEWAIGAPKDYPEADAIILLDQAQMEVSIESIRYHRLVRIKILTEAGIEEVGEQSFGYFKGTDKITKFKAHTITPNGKKHKIGKKAAHTQTYGNYRERTFAFPKLEVGAIIEYEYTNASKRYQYLAPWYFQNSLYTMLSSFAVTLNNGFTYNYVTYELRAAERTPEIDSVINVEGHGRDAWHKTYSWRVENIPPVTAEPYMGAVDRYRSSMKFQLRTYESRYNRFDFTYTWDKLGEDAQYIIDEYTNRRGDVRQLAEQITQGATTDMEKSALLYNYVVNNYQTAYDYKSTFFANDHTEDLLKTGFGSPEEKNLLLVLMHQQLKIPSQPVMICTRSYGKLWQGSPDLRQFNHVLTYVQFGDSYVLLDAATKLRPYGVLPPDCLVDIGFMISGKNSELIRLSTVPLTSFRTDATKVFLNGEGSATCSTTCIMGGYYASKYAQIAERKTAEDFVNENFLKYLDLDYEIGAQESFLDDQQQLIVRMDFEIPELATSLGSNLVISPIALAFRSNPFYKPKRLFPVDFQYPFTFMNVVEIYPPLGITDYQLPENLELSFGTNSFTRQSEVRDSVILLVQTLVIDQPLFRPPQYQGLREFFTKIVMGIEAQVVAVREP